MKNRKVWVFDLEQFPNFHSGYFINPDTEEERIFILHESRNDISEYVNFLKTEVKGLIGFNNVNYDSKLLNIILKNPFQRDLIRALYRKSKQIINNEARWEKDLIPQLDLFKIHHYNNKARGTSLKWIEFYLRMNDVMDLPLDPESEVEPHQFDDIIYYNRNDVLATRAFYDYTVDQGMIQLRKDITKQFGINAMNLNDVSIGEKINAIYYSKFSKRRFSEYREARTYRPTIAMADCMPDYLHFETDEINNVVNKFKTEVLEGTKGELDYDISLGGNVYSLKNGGLHSHDKPRYLKPTKDQRLVEIDVASMYPSMLIENNAYPEHLGPEWLQGYKFIRDDRVKAKNTGDKVKADSYKLALNGGGFGKTNSSFSWMYDPLTKNMKSVDFDAIEKKIKSENKPMRLRGLYKKDLPKTVDAFIQHFMTNFNEKFETLTSRTRKRICETGKRRSFGEIYMITKYYYPDTNVAEVFEALYKRVGKQNGFRSSPCGIIKKRTYYYKPRGNAALYDGGYYTDEFGYKANDYLAALGG